MNELGLAPQFSDTFRAAQSTQAGLLRRLERSGITAVLIASTSTEDLFTIARDMNRLKINLELITTEAMMVLPFMEEADQIAPGLKIIGWPIARAIPDQEQEDAPDLLLLRDPTVISGYSSFELAMQAIGSSTQATTQRLSQGNFRTSQGMISFNDDGSSKFNPYSLLQWDGETLNQVNVGQPIQ